VNATTNPVNGTIGETWSSRLTRSIAAQIRQRRKARKWSAQRLSDECAELGLEFPRTTLADLENGRRRSISVAELLVAARALEITPACLLPGEDPAAWLCAVPEAPDPAPDPAAEAITALRRDMSPVLTAILGNVTELSRLLEPERATP
jgi:transcriptional regulator with XRE-family HTH domain